MRRRLLASVAALALAVTAACSGDGDERDEGGGPTTTAAPSEAEALAEQLGCGRVEAPSAGGYEGWVVRDVRDCEAGSGWAQARIYASLSAEERAAAVRLLAMDAGGEQASSPGQRCTASEGEGMVDVVAGDTWVVVAYGDAAWVTGTLGGEVQAMRVSPPPSTPATECFPP
jgi:hypothetical protein